MRLSLWALSAALLMGCPPPCKNTCKKVLACGNLQTDRLALDACVDDCQRQDALYNTWNDEQKQELFADHRRCLKQSTCDEIAAGECYVGYEELFLFDESERGSETTASR